MRSQSLELLTTRWHGTADAMPAWLFIAAVLHAIILISVGFSTPEPKKVSKAIEITLVSSATKKAPKNAKYLAQENQIGAGTEKQKPKPAQQKTPSMGKNKQKKGETTKPKPKTSAAPRIITQKKKAVKKVVKTKKVAKKPKSKPKQPELSMEALERQIAQLGERVKYLKQSSEKTNIKFVKSISTHRYIAAQYVKDWTRKVERIGNLNYPNIAKKRGFSVSMDVGIKKDGTLYNIKIIKSSGDKKLDEAAKRIVRISAPFSPLPKQIAAQLDVLKIRRVWSFSDESSLSTRSR